MASLYDIDGERLAFNDDFGDSKASRIVWQAANAGDYYVEVQDIEGGTGTYTLTVELADIGDDHGNTIENATEIAFGETVSGTIGYEIDNDIFCFVAEAGEWYRASVALGTLEDYWIGMWDSQGRFQPHSSGLMRARQPGQYYVEVAAFGLMGTYTLTITGR